MSAVAPLQAYVERHFVQLPELAARAGTDGVIAGELVAAGVAPQPSYPHLAERRLLEPGRRGPWRRACRPVSRLVLTGRRLVDTPRARHG